MHTKIKNSMKEIMQFNNEFLANDMFDYTIITLYNV